MLDKLTKFNNGCRTAYKRKTKLTKKLVKNPFFPILFISEAVKMLVLATVTTTSLLSAPVIAMIVLAAVSTTLWVFAEVIMDEVEEITE